MTEIHALVINSVDGVMPADDGTKAFVKIKTGAAEMVIALQSDQMIPLISLLAFANTACGKLLGRPSEERQIYKTSWFEISKSVLGGNLILSLTFGEGGVLSFDLPGTMGQQLLETLQTALGVSTPLTPGTSVQ